jgi:lipoate-protein ligase A
MERHRQALEALLKKPVSVRGHTDLTLGDLKFSGNSQRRKRSRLLFHGTFLLDFDLKMIESCLLAPKKQPAYRRQRSHGAFVTNLGVSAERVMDCLREAWGARGTLKSAPEERMRRLIEERYSRPDWNLKF